MKINTSGQPRPPSPRLAPLQHPPRGIRPPFNTASHDTAADHPTGETTQQRQARGRADRVIALLEPLDGIELGAYDRRILDWLADWDTTTIGTIASLLYRARAIGHDESTTQGAQHGSADRADNGTQPKARDGAR
jgi:hypothetical protein